MPRRKKRTYGSGSVRQKSVTRKDGSVRTYWEARFSDGRDPKTGKVIRGHAYMSHLCNGHGKTPKTKRHARGTTVTHETNVAAVKRMLPYK